MRADPFHSRRGRPKRLGSWGAARVRSRAGDRVRDPRDFRQKCKFSLRSERAPTSRSSSEARRGSLPWRFSSETQIFLRLGARVRARCANLPAFWAKVLGPFHKSSFDLSKFREVFGPLHKSSCGLRKSARAPAQIFLRFEQIPRGVRAPSPDQSPVSAETPEAARGGPCRHRGAERE